jgi:hypothetical protein
LGGVLGQSGPHWRRVLAALGNRDARTAYAQIVLGEDVLPEAREQRRTRAIAILLEAGLVDLTANGEVIAEDLTERQVNERLLSYTEDVVLLRRYLVDFGLLERTASGSSHSRPV